MRAPAVLYCNANMARPYEAPVALMHLTLDTVASVTGARELEGYRETLTDLAEPILESAARFAQDVLSPLNTVGDRSPSRRDGQRVITPPGFVDAYRRFREDGWVSLGAPTQYGGQGLPTLLSAAVTEMWGGANLAFAMCPELAAGALESFRLHGTPQLVEDYAQRIASGQWATAMCLTEPQAGSDLSTLRTRAEPDGEAWKLHGRKIFISWGDHDMTDNIVHFVLARAPDAPPGLRGISLFLVPKRLRSPQGDLVPNDIEAVSLEHKMGIRASPTCVMVLGERGGARGWLIGRLHEGMSCMFTMMNHMRLGVGVHSLGLAERALQLARTHAQERLQGRDRSGRQCPIIEHADVRRMLLRMKALTQAARGLCYTAAATLDLSHAAPDPAQRARASSRADLLTPIVKAWCSDAAVEVASLGLQVHGGSGYVEDAEISQVYRDARIGPIFEGTNYIQAQDLLARKIVRDQGEAVRALLADFRHAAHALPAHPEHPLSRLRSGLLDGTSRFHNTLARLIPHAASEPELVGATAHHVLQWLGTLAGAWQWALLATRAQLPEYNGAPAAIASGTIIDTAAFYAAQILPAVHCHEAVVEAGAGPVMKPSTADL